MRISLPLIAASAVYLAGCAKKPSEEFASASRLHTTLYGASQEDAYLDPRMGDVEALLTRVPAESRDAPAAAELLTRVRTGRERAAEEKAARERTVNQALAPIHAEPLSPRAEEAPASGGEPPVFDAGPAPPPQLFEGMSIDQFQKQLGDCFEDGPPLQLPQGPATTFRLRDRRTCRERHPLVGAGWVTFVESKLIGISTLQTPDAGP